MSDDAVKNGVNDCVNFDSTSHSDVNKADRRTNVAISVLAKDTPGLLARLSCVFSRRGKNILAISAGRDPRRIGFSEIKIVCDADRVDQIVNQLNKLVDVQYARIDTSN